MKIFLKISPRFSVKRYLFMLSLFISTTMRGMEQLTPTFKANTAHLKTAGALLKRTKSKAQEQGEWGKEQKEERHDVDWFDQVRSDLRKLTGQLAPGRQERQPAQQDPAEDLIVETLSLSPEEESELLGNPDPASPTGSFQAKKAVVVPVIIPTSPVSSLSEVPVRKQRQWPYNRDTKPVPRAWREAKIQAPNRACVGYVIPIIASMSPSKTGDICGSIIERYTTHKS